MAWPENITDPRDIPHVPGDGRFVEGLPTEEAAQELCELVNDPARRDEINELTRGEPHLEQIAGSLVLSSFYGGYKRGEKDKEELLKAHIENGVIG